MNRSLFLFLICSFGVIANASAGRSTDEQVKHPAQRHTQVEAQLDRAVHYLKKESPGGGTMIEQAWFNGAGDLIKVAVEQEDAAGRELTEYFARDVGSALTGRSSSRAKRRRLQFLADVTAARLEEFNQDET